MKPGRLALLLTASLYVALLVWAALVLPDRVPSHFDAAGRVDAHSSRTSLLVLFGLVGLFVLVGIPLISRWAASGDGRWVNMPRGYKDYWFEPSRRAEFRERFRHDLEVFAAITGLLLAAILGITTWVGRTRRDGVPWWVMAALIGGYLLAAVIWTVALMRAYRPPASGA